MNLDLNPMFDPKSITIIGASGGEGKLSAIPLHNLKANGYQGKVYPVNPKYKEIAGYKCFKEIESLPKEIDLAIVSVGADYVLPILERLAQREIKSAVVFSSGFSEAGSKGKVLQEKLASFCERSKIPVCGPNSLGLYNRNKGMLATFAAHGFTQHEPVAFVTQSGAFGSFTYELAKELGLGYDYSVSTGNEANVDFFDFVEYFAKVETIKVIGGYIEGARDVTKMTKAINTAHKNNKPLVLMKVGNSRKGAEAATSHTSSLAGNQSVYKSFFKQNNVVQVSNEEELIDTLTVFNKVKVSPKRGGLGIVTISGGTGIVMADKCEEYGVEIAKLMPETTARLKELLPPFAAVTNPVDVTAQAIQYLDNLQESLEVLLGDENIEAVVFYMQIGHSLSPYLVPKLIEVSKQTNKTFIVCWSGASKETREALISGDVCWLPTPTRAVTAVNNLMNYYKNKETIVGNKANYLREPESTTAFEGILTEHLGKQIISKYGIPIPRGRVASSADEAVQIAEEIGYPIVLKANSKDITHKSEMGAVITGLVSQDEILHSYNKIVSNCLNGSSEVKLDGILVEEMCDEGKEVFIGCFQDPLFGPCMMFGLGGIYVEVLSDVAVKKAPLTRRDAEEMVRSIKGYKILEGVRKEDPSDIDALVTALINLSFFCWDHRDSLQELDINPLVVHKEGEGVSALDTLIVGKSLVSNV
ncbi:acetate--CoA ligase family protein [Lentibacillus sp. Marseille-P4043]|uniref:acetate--CoA ligase family protein n=1 Tax=Lentibacillus sp. Marseille-P4043 TaxID=2040293 RepID=UPI001F18423C|nr:acetate--CoA ligase family protein [Lentibacillus sp. Marseille-P4043]